MTTLDALNHPTHAEHWTATATDEQRIRAEAAIIAAALLRSKTPFGDGTVKPVDVMILADWIIDGPFEDGDEAEVEVEIANKLCRRHNPDGPENCWMKTGHDGPHSWQVDTVDTMETTPTKGAP